MQCSLWFCSVFQVQGSWLKCYGYHLSIIITFVINKGAKVAQKCMGINVEIETPQFNIPQLHRICNFSGSSRKLVFWANTRVLPTQSRRSTESGRHVSYVILFWVI